MLRSWACLSLLEDVGDGPSRGVQGKASASQLVAQLEQQGHAPAGGPVAIFHWERHVNVAKQACSRM